MADCDDPLACAIRAVTRRCGPTIWSDPGRLRSRLHYEMNPVSARQSAVLDGLVIAAVHGLPAALLADDDLQPLLLALSDAVGPLLAAEAMAVWGRALDEPELICDGAIAPAPFVLDTAPGMIVIDVRCVEVELAPATEIEVESALEVVRVAEVAAEGRVPTLIDKLRPPPPVPVSA